MSRTGLYTRTHAFSAAMGSQRPISTLSLPRSTISALTRAGYETTQDLVGSAANDLAKGGFDTHI